MAKMEIDTFMQDAILSYFKRVVDHADKVLEKRHIISKGQLLSYVQNTRANAQEALNLIAKGRN